MVFATFLAPCIRPTYQYVADRVGSALGQPVRLVTGESLEQLRTGEVAFAFICGLPYVRLRREAPAPVRLVAAPVLSGDRYQGRPIYFSDVIVPRDSPVTSLEQLRGRRFAYNGPDSHSGALVVLHRLREMGETTSFFGQVVMTGSHQASIRQVAAGQADGSAIDSQVLAVELRDHPDLRERVRVVASLGPSTIPPLVASARTAPSLDQEVREVVTGLGAGRGDLQGLGAGLVSGFHPVEDPAYDDIGRMLAAVEAARLAF